MAVRISKHDTAIDFLINSVSTPYLFYCHNIRGRQFAPILQSLRKPLRQNAHFAHWGRESTHAASLFPLQNSDKNGISYLEGLEGRLTFFKVVLWWFSPQDWLPPERTKQSNSAFLTTRHSMTSSVDFSCAPATYARELANYVQYFIYPACIPRPRTRRGEPYSWVEQLLQELQDFQEQHIKSW